VKSTQDKPFKYFEWAVCGLAVAVIGLLLLGGTLEGDMIARYAPWALVMVPVYIIPSFVAWERRHRNRNAIIALNILLGWTFVGWAVALVWALTVDKKN
jgi:hypothetical protein